MVEMTNQLQLLFPVLPEKEVAARLDPDNPKCAFHQSKYVGNRAAVDEILDLAHSAFQTRLRYKGNGTVMCPRRCPKRIALLGRASVGKTTFAKIFAKNLLGLPFCCTTPEQITSAAILFDLLVRAYSEYNIDIVVEEERGDTNYYVLPAGVLFIDEVHLVPGKVQDALLNVTESNDGTLLVESGVVDCRNLTIIIATTDKGKLRSAFKTRFRHIQLQPHNTAEIAQIVQINQPTWMAADCMAVARIKPIPREAKDFADSVVLCANRRGLAIPKAIAVVCQREGIGEGGVNANALRTLRALKEAPDGLSKGSLCAALSIEAEEFENDVMPCLVANDLHPAYIQINHRHIITDAGRTYIESQP